MTKSLRYEDILGNEEIKEHLKAAARSGHISHAYLIEGPSGMGKRLIAKTFAAALMCEASGAEPCCECRSCRRVMSGNQTDLIQVTHEKPQLVRVEDIRRQVISDTAIRPDSRYKVYIIDDAEKMNEAAQNALLKTIEEPPAYVVIILLAANRSTLLPTILSRCICLEMKPVPFDEITAFITEQTGAESQKARLCASFAQGVPGKALMLAQSEDFISLRDAAVGLVKRIDEIDPVEMGREIRRINTFHMEPNDYLDLLMVWYRDLLRFKATQDPDGLIFPDELSEIRRQASLTSYNGIMAVLEGLDKAKERLRANVNYDLTMELLFRTMKEKAG